MKLTQIHQDRRGEINLLEGLIKGNKEVTILKTVKGFSRGGCVHNKSLEYFAVIEGEVKLYVGEKVIVLVAGESVFIPKGHPHYFIALEDCIIIEFGATREEKKKKDATYRQIVERINKEMDNK